MSKFHKQSENMKALEQSLNDHMEICSLERQVKRLNAKNARLKAEVERLTWLQVETLNERNKAEVERLTAKEGKPNGF